MIVAAAILGGAAPAGAQRALTVAPLVSLVEHRVDAGFGVERSLGPIVGAVGTLRVGPRLEAAVRAVPRPRSATMKNTRLTPYPSRPL